MWNIRKQSNLPFWLDVIDSGLLAAVAMLMFEIFSVTTLTSSALAEFFAVLSTEAGVGTLTTFVDLMLEILRMAESFFPFLLGECLRAENLK